VTQDPASSLVRQLSDQRWLPPAIAVILLAGVMSAAIAWRVSAEVTGPGSLAVFAWQLAVWLPWLGYYFLARALHRRLQAAGFRTAVIAATQAFMAVLVAISHLAWYWQISRHFSPFVGMEHTKYGAYRFFFVFWFLIDLLLYPGCLAAPGLRRTPDDDARLDDYPAHFAVRKGRAQHVVQANDIRWIEAQGYYAALHTDADSFLMRRSLAALEKELDPGRFVRIHRSTIVNIDAVSEIYNDDSGAVTAILKQGVRRRVSRTGRRRLRHHLSLRG
jgi:hypothetical protein